MNWSNDYSIKDIKEYITKDAKSIGVILYDLKNNFDNTESLRELCNQFKIYNGLKVLIHNSIDSRILGNSCKRATVKRLGDEVFDLEKLINSLKKELNPKNPKRVPDFILTNKEGTELECFYNSNFLIVISTKNWKELEINHKKIINSSKNKKFINPFFDYFMNNWYHYETQRIIPKSYKYEQWCHQQIDCVYNKGWLTQPFIIKEKKINEEITIDYKSKKLDSCAYDEYISQLNKPKKSD